jgi:hypothetical protein
MQTQKRQAFNRRAAAKKLEEAWRDVLKKNGLAQNPAEVRQVLSDVRLSPKTPLARGLNIGMSVGLGGLGRAMAQKVKSERQLENALALIREAGEKMPTAIRKALKELGHALPRRGGPGRQPKLNTMQAGHVCDQIALLLRQGHKLKSALQKVAELTPTLLGKKVGARTLQKAWDRRGEYRSE